MSMPSRIGRYRIVGHLAAGGMAEILLAKVFGPAGFEQAVVLKRILPHLLRQKSFASMFVDEAQIVARINHPNVVRVFELGQEGGELFLVMEYLEGESLHGVTKRLSTRDRHLDFALGAYLIAEACAGLHAAHEMRDLEGNPQNLVHRDISPQNVFLTYDGTVKLLDFGIAKAADRITRTEAGEIKGKYAYMSPEQVDAKPLDRRSDLFSLGTLLYESTTGRRLFQRASVMLTMRAITERPIRPPSEVVDGYPPALEEVVMRALERDPERRYQTAAEMRRALLEVLRDLHAVAPEEQLAELMHDLFADRIGEKREMLRRLSAGSHVTHVPSAEVDEEVELPLVGTEEEPSGDLPETVTEARPRLRRRWPLAALVAAAVVGLGLWSLLDDSAGEGGVAVLPAAGDPGKGDGSEGSRDGALRADPDGGTTGLAVALTDAGTTGPNAGAEVPVDAGAAIEGTVTLRVTTRPAGAWVWVDGQRRGTSPLEVTVPRSDEAVLVRARRAGRRGAVSRVVPDEDREVELRLRRSRPGPAGSSEPEIERFH